MLRFPLALTAALTLLANLSAQSGDYRLQTILPPRVHSAEGNDSTTMPFGAGNRRIQLAYGRHMLDQDGPVRITGLAFRPDQSVVTAVPAGSWNITIDISTGTNLPDALSHTFDDNHGADRRRVVSGTVTAQPLGLGSPPHRFLFQFLLSSRFVWDPRCGPLILDFQITSATGTPFLSDAVSDGTESYGLIANVGSANAATANHPATGVTRRVPVLDLRHDTLPVPNIPLTAGGLSLRNPFSPSTPQQRIQFTYDPSQIPFSTARRITRLGWRPVNGAASRTMDLMVTLSTGGPAAQMGPTFDLNHGIDRMVVFDGLWTTPEVPVLPAGIHGYEVSLPLMREFSFNPYLGSLVVDIQIRSVTGSSSSRWDYVTNTGVAELWSGASAFATTGQTLAPRAPTLALAALPSPVVPRYPATTSLTATIYPWAQTGSPRIVHAYGSAALGTSQIVIIRQLSWQLATDPAAHGPAAHAATIDLSTGPNPVSGLSPILDSNHGPDRMRVFDGIVTTRFHSDTVVGYFDFAVTADLDQPFRWDPTQGPLIVDIRVPGGMVGGTLGRHLRAHLTSHAARVGHNSQPNAVFANFGPQGYVPRMRINGPRCRGTAEPYGTACGSPRLLATTEGEPAIGTVDFGLRLRRARANTFATCAFALSPANLNLAQFGAPTCTGLTTGDLGVLWFVTDPNGSAFASVVIPNVPAFSGFTFFQQWVALDAAAPGGLTASGGLKIKIGG